MKNQIKSLFLVILFAGISNAVWGQASTEGKDFWVANTIVCQPPSASSPAFPTIAVSAQNACTVTITDYAGNQLAKANVAAGSWTRFGENTAAIDPADYYLDPSKWYPTANHINATDVYNHADKINNYGIVIITDNPKLGDNVFHSVDDLKEYEEKVQKITDKFVKEVEKACETKEKELMEI